jgi:hypothetical protein
MIGGGFCRSWRSLRSFGGIEIAGDQNQKIAACGSSSIKQIGGAFSSPAKQELP